MPKFLGSTDMQGKNPFRITSMLVLVLLFTTWNIIRLATAIAWHDTLNAYTSPPVPVYIAVSGGFWSLLGIFIGSSLIRRAAWTRPALLFGSFAYGAWVWVDRLYIRAQIGSNWPFSLAATIVLLGYVTAVVLDPRNQTYFMKRGL